MICENRLSESVVSIFPEDDEDKDVFCELDDIDQVQFDNEVVLVSTDISPEGAIELFKLKMRIARLEETVAILQSMMASSPTQCFDSANADPCLADVIEITEEMFGGEPEVSVDRDPEYPEVRFVTFTVNPTGTVDDLVLKRIDWHERISQLPPASSGAFRLSIVPR